MTQELDGRPINRAAAGAAVLGGLLGAGWALVAIAFLVSQLTQAKSDAGDWLALGILAFGLLILAAICLVGARATWRGELSRRLSTGGLCTVVLAGWPAIGAVSRGVGAVATPTGLIAIALTIAGGVTLYLLARARKAMLPAD